MEITTDTVLFLFVAVFLMVAAVPGIYFFWSKYQMNTKLEKEIIRSLAIIGTFTSLGKSKTTK